MIVVSVLQMNFLGELGPPGRPGASGKDGEPGIQAWKVNVNDYNQNDILVPPSIVGKILMRTISFFMQICEHAFPC